MNNLIHKLLFINGENYSYYSYSFPLNNSSLFSENLSFLFSLLLFFRIRSTIRLSPFPLRGDMGGLFFYNFFAAPGIDGIVCIVSAARDIESYVAFIGV